jgi:hypothetical protein
MQDTPTMSITVSTRAKDVLRIGLGALLFLYSRRVAAEPLSEGLRVVGTVGVFSGLRGFRFSEPVAVGLTALGVLGMEMYQKRIKGFPLLGPFASSGDYALGWGGWDHRHAGWGDYDQNQEHRHHHHEHHDQW